MKLIYLDMCCFNRPYDDQSQARIRLETEAKLLIQENIRQGKCRLAWSAILDFECSKNPYPEHPETFIRSGQGRAAGADEEKRRNHCPTPEDDLQTSETETAIELNFAVLKFKHTIKKKGSNT